MTPLPDSLLEAVASAAVREGLADAVFTRLNTPIGRLLVVQGPNGIARVGFEEEPEDALLAGVAAELGPRVVASDRELAGTRDALSAYLEGDGDTLDAARRPALRARAVPARGARDAARHGPPRRGRHLRRARRALRAPAGLPRRRDRLRPQPGPDRRALPPRAPEQRRDRQLRRRRRAQAGAAGARGRAVAPANVNGAG